MRDLACPGFVGEAISQAEWGELLRWVGGLQRALLRSGRGPSVIPAQAGIQAD